MIADIADRTLREGALVTSIIRILNEKDRDYWTDAELLEEIDHAARFMLPEDMENAPLPERYREEVSA